MAVNPSSLAGTIPTIYYDQVDDLVARKCFQNLNDYFSNQNQFYGFNFFEVVFTTATANKLVKHGLTYIPQDVVVLRVTGTGNVTFNFGLFDTSNVNLTVTGPCRVRFFVGTYWNFQNSANSQQTDAQTYYSSVNSGSGATSTSSYAQVTAPLTQAQIATQASLFPGSSVQNYMIRSTDSIIFVSGTTQVTLPLAATVTGQKFVVYKTDNTFLVTTVVTQGSDKLLDAANSSSGSTTTSTTLNTLQENVEFYSDGTQWRVLLRDYYKGQVAYVPGATPAGFTTNVTTTTLWSRQGNKMTVDFDMRFTGATNVPSGGRGQVNFPAGLTVDANRMKYPPTVSASICGFGIVITSAGNAYDFCPFMLPADTNLVNFGALQIITVHTGTVFPNDTDVNQTQPAVVANGTGMMGQFTVPITGWKG